MSNLTRVRRANVRKSIEAHRQGTPLAAPIGSLRFVAWVAGERQAAKVGKRSHFDLDRGHARVPAERERQYRCAPPFTPPALPARQAKRTRQPGRGRGLITLAESRRKAAYQARLDALLKPTA